MLVGRHQRSIRMFWCVDLPSLSRSNPDVRPAKLPASQWQSDVDRPGLRGDSDPSSASDPKLRDVHRLRYVSEFLATVFGMRSGVRSRF